MQYLVQYSHESLSSKKDYEETKAFFDVRLPASFALVIFFADIRHLQTKDTSKYKMTLQQSKTYSSYAQFGF